MYNGKPMPTAFQAEPDIRLAYEPIKSIIGPINYFCIEGMHYGRAGPKPKVPTPDYEGTPAEVLHDIYPWDNVPEHKEPNSNGFSNGMVIGSCKSCMNSSMRVYRLHRSNAGTLDMELKQAEHSSLS